MVPFNIIKSVLTTRGLFLCDFSDIIPGLTFRKFGKSGIIEAPVMSISHSVIESVLKKFILLSVSVKKCLDETHLCFFFVFEFDLNKSKITKLFIVNSFNAIEGQLTCSSFAFASFIFCSSCSNRIFTFTTAYSTYQTWQKLFGWNSILLSKLWSDWGRSCQNFPRATKVWSWHTNNQTSNALTYETLGRFLSDTDDWLMLKYFTHPIMHNARFTHLKLANIPMQIRAGAFVGSIQKLKNHHHF